MRKLMLLAFVVALAAGCDVGSGGGDDAPADVMPDDEEKIVCTATLAMSGTFTALDPLTPTGGCQPAGTWNVNVAVTDMGTCTDVPVLSNYVYNVTETADGRTDEISYSGPSENVRLQISASGGGECTASFEHITGSGMAFHEIDLHPQLPEPTAGGTTLTIGGDGEYNLWTEHP